MKPATISLPDDLGTALEIYLRSHGAPPTLATVTQAALREYLAARGFLPGSRGPLAITPAEQGSGLHDVSIEHDRYFADGQ